MSRSSMRAQPPSTHSRRLDRLSQLPRRANPHRLRSPSHSCPIQPTIPQQRGGRHNHVPLMDQYASIYILRPPSCASRPHPRRAPRLCTLLLYPRPSTRDHAGTLGSVGPLCDALVRGFFDNGLDGGDGWPARCHDGGWRFGTDHRKGLQSVCCAFRPRAGSCKWAPAAAVRLERGSPEWESDDA